MLTHRVTGRNCVPKGLPSDPARLPCHSGWPAGTVVSCWTRRKTQALQEFAFREQLHGGPSAPVHATCSGACPLLHTRGGVHVRSKSRLFQDNTLGLSKSQKYPRAESSPLPGRRRQSTGRRPVTAPSPQGRSWGSDERSVGKCFQRRLALRGPSINTSSCYNYLPSS